MKFTNQESVNIFRALDCRTYMAEDSSHDRAEYAMVMNLWRRFREKDSPRLTLYEKEYLYNLCSTFYDYNMQHDHYDDKERSDMRSVLRKLGEILEYEISDSYKEIL